MPDTKFQYRPPTGAIKAQTIDRISSRVVVYLTMITPQIAEIWLGHNSHNRTLRPATVEMLQGVIERGEFFLNGDAIRWSKNGVLLDGQHRLWAIVNTGIAVPSLVIVGLEPEAQETMDYGARRRLSDALKLRGEPNSVSLAATLNYWYRYETGQLRYVTARPTVAQALAVLDANPDLRTCTLMAGNVIHRTFRISQAMVSSAWYEFHTIDSEDAEAFFRSVALGAELKVKDPRILLRKHLEANSLAGATNRASSLVSHALIIKAWNLWRDGRTTDRLSWKSGGVKAEEFPEPH